MAHDSRYLYHSDNERRVFWVLIITAALMPVEVVGGLIQGSFAFLADHMLTDANGKTLLGIKRLLADDYGIIHSTIQTKCCACSDDH